MANGLVRRYRGEQFENSGWMKTLFVKTIPLYLIVFVAAAGAGFYANSICPAAKHIMDLKKEICRGH